MDLTHITQWRPLVAEIAPRYGLDPALVLAVIAQESSGDPYASRAEPGFARRYARGIRAIVKGTASKRDDRWLRRGRLINLATSYGLMQVLLDVAIERGMLPDLKYPEYLCKPNLGIEAGCRHLSWLKRRYQLSDHQMLLRYNGGGDPDYPAKILRWRTRLTDAA